MTCASSSSDACQVTLDATDPAAADVLRRYTGSDAFGAAATIEAGSSRTEPGRVPARDLTLHWDTFSAAADEADLSRRYGGIHFQQGELVGRAVGGAVGARVWHLATAYRNGAALAPDSRPFAPSRR